MCVAQRSTQVPESCPPGSVPRETSDRLAVFERLLREWNPRINLVARGTIDHVRERHVADSLQLCEWLPPQGMIVDLGSGAGFPGLIVGLATGRPVILVEADKRKAAFLREAARLTGTAATVIASRIEESGLQDVDIILARALGSLSCLCAMASSLLARDGVCLFLKGAQVGRELTEAAREWQMSATRHPSRVTPEGCVLEVRHLERRRPSD